MAKFKNVSSTPYVTHLGAEIQPGAVADLTKEEVENASVAAWIKAGELKAESGSSNDKK